jgi:MFS family permease
LTADATGIALQPVRLRRATVVGLLLATAQAPLGSTLASVGLPDLSRSLAVALPAATTWIVTSYLVVSIVGQSPGGKLGDLVGATRTVRIGMLMQVVGAACGTLASQLPALVLARVAMALGSACVIPSTIALLRARTPVAEHGRMFGAVSATMGLSGAVGPALGGELVARFGWRSMFAAPLALTLFAGVLLAWAGIDESHRDAARSRDGVATGTASEGLRGAMRDFDGIGTLLMAAWLSALFAFSRVQNVVTLGVFVLSFALFLIREQRTRVPVFDLRLFTRPGFAAGSTLVALHNFAMYGVLFLLPGYFEHVRHSDPATVGRTLFAMMVGMFTMAPIGGRLCDRFGARASAVFGVFPLLAGMLVLQNLVQFERPSQALVGLACVGAGVGLCNASAMASAMSSLPSSAAASGAGAISTLRYLGGVFSILTLSLSARLGENSLEAHVVALRTFAIASLISALVALALPTTRRTARSS